MSASNTETQDIGWVSGFLLVFGILSALVAALSLFSGSVHVGMLAIAVAVVFFALRRIIEQQEAAARRLRQIEIELQGRRGGGA